MNTTQEQPETEQHVETEVLEREPEQHPEPEVHVMEPVPDDIADATRRARALIPVGHGASPINFAQQVDFAKTMAQAVCAIPKHLQKNAGDCLAVIDIAQGAGLHPYMVANQTYVGPDGRLAFMSQLHHALLIQSGRIRDAALHHRFEGDGDDMVCIVWATLMGEKEPREHRSQPISKVRPKMGDKGVRKGSPLWDKKPEVQFFYDTGRDWGRIFCPIATLGLLAMYESQETPVKPEITQGIRDRLKIGSNGTEGHKDGHAAEELSRVASDKGGIEPAGDGEPNTIKPAGDTKKPATTKAAPKAAPKKEQPKRNAKPASKAQASAAADRAQARSDQNKAKQQPAPKAEEPPKVPTKPKTAAEYQVYAMDWINRMADPEEIAKRWATEADMRNELAVPIKVRNSLRAHLETKHGIEV